MTIHELIDAIDLVTNDQRCSYPEMTPEEAVGYARYALWVHVDGQPDGPANWEVTRSAEEPELDEMYEAYRAVLLATESELQAALTAE